VHLIRLVVLLVFALIPLTGNDYLTVQLTQYMVYGIFAMSLSLLWGSCASVTPSFSGSGRM
jgi:ABC-type branched-subunit amino acid transport system permease subunit